jgi:hypothetical protein
VPHRTLPESVRRLVTASPASRGAGHFPRPLKSPAANERLTALAGLALLFLLAAEGVTLLFLRPLLPAHMFIGLLLVPPVLLKLVATGWRFAQYYLGDAEYVRFGPPRLLLRLLAPVLVLSTVMVLATGIVLMISGPVHRGPWLLLHKASFVIWGPTFGIHVLAYLWRVPRLALSAALVGVLALGVVFAVAAYADVHPVVHGWFPDFDGDRG